MEFLTKKVKGIIGIDDIDVDIDPDGDELLLQEKLQATEKTLDEFDETCLLYTSPSPRDRG